MSSVSSGIPASLAAGDGMLAAEMQYLVDQAWSKLEHELYVNSAGQTIDPEIGGVLADCFCRWSVRVESLIECYLFDILRTARPAGRADCLREHLAQESNVSAVCTAVNLLAEYSRRLYLPTLRAERSDESNGGLPLYWLGGGGLQGAFCMAERLVARELDALWWLQGDRSLRPAEATPCDLLAECAGPHPPNSRERLIRLRIVLAHLVRQGLLRATDSAEAWRVDAVQPEVWEDLRAAMVRDVRPLIFGRGTGDQNLYEFCLATRLRYLDACLMNPIPQVRDLRMEVETCARLWSGEHLSRGEDRYDSWYCGQTHLIDSWSGSSAFEQREQRLK
jgi:hypothetical protein